MADRNTNKKMHFSYAEIHASVSAMASRIEDEVDPEVILAVGGGGFIPARMLRSALSPPALPIYAITLKLYDDSSDAPAGNNVEVLQWADESAKMAIAGKRVLIVDEVDDTRRTMSFAVKKIKETLSPASLAVFVVHEKVKAKAAELPTGVKLLSAAKVPDEWLAYPWDAQKYAPDIWQHEARAASHLGKCEYEVNIFVDKDILNEYVAWLKPHMEEIDNLPGFLFSTLTELELEKCDESEGSMGGKRVGLCARYYLRDRQSLEDYFNVHAARLRGDGINKFKGRFTITRRVLQKTLLL